MPTRDDESVRARYEAAADRPEVQGLIRAVIRSGAVRVSRGPSAGSGSRRRGGKGTGPPARGGSGSGRLTRPGRRPME